jgi:hypothetical protein
MRRLVFVAAIAVGFSCTEKPEYAFSCTELPNCRKLANERAVARGKLELDQERAALGDRHAAASLSHDSDEIRRAELRYHDACLR